MTNALEVEHLTVRFGTTEVIRGLSFGVPRGTSLAIIGPNGAGKTVLFKALIGSIPYEGTIRWAEDTKLGYVPQKLDIERDLPLSGRDFLRAKAAISKVSPLIGNPNVVLLDEPAAGIDEPGEEKINTMIQRLQEERGVTVLLISHDLSIVYQHATAVLCMSRTNPCFGVPQKVLTPETLRELYGTGVGFHVHDHDRN